MKSKKDSNKPMENGEAVVKSPKPSTGARKEKQLNEYTPQEWNKLTRQEKGNAYAKAFLQNLNQKTAED